MRFVGAAWPRAAPAQIGMHRGASVHARPSGVDLVIPRFRLLAWGITAVLWASSAQGAAPDGLRSRVDAIAAQHLGQGAAPGLAIGVHENGREATFFYGDAGRDLGTPTADTLFELGSVTQVFTATKSGCLSTRLMFPGI